MLDEDLRVDILSSPTFLSASPPSSTFAAHLSRNLQKWSVLSIASCSFLIMVSRRLEAYCTSVEAQTAEENDHDSKY
jgi:hypothetical protein